jgi:SH3-like domain-containing protein
VPKATARAKTRGGWVTSVARNWAVVRSDPTRQSRIIAAIGPNTRVQLGETRGAWRRIKAKGLAGWVEHRSLIATSYSAPKSRLAAR